MYMENLDKLPQGSKLDIGYEGNGGSRADCLPLRVETSWQVHTQGCNSTKRHFI